MKIAILGKYYGQNKTLMVSGPYQLFFREFLEDDENDLLMVIDPMFKGIIPDLDLLVLPGGEDVNPERYGEKTNVHTTNPNVHYEWFDKNVLPKYIDANIPIFGICRGFQTLNVAFGGKLDQHLYNHPSSNERYEAAHELVFENQKHLGFKIDDSKGKLEVNSLHHQGVSDKVLSNDMIPIAYSYYGKNKHNIEAMKHKEKPIVGVQWHPEEIWDVFSIKTVQQLLEKK